MGRYGFLDAYDPDFICNHTDEQGRYSFANQPGIAHWNLRALALALSSLIDSDALVEKLDTYEAHLRRPLSRPDARQAGFGARRGGR